MYLDVSGDGYVSAIDALMIINYLHANPVSPVSSTALSSGEAEGDHEAAEAAALDTAMERQSLASIAFAEEDLDGFFWAFEDGKKREER